MIKNREQFLIAATMVMALVLTFLTTLPALSQSKSEFEELDRQAQFFLYLDQGTSNQFKNFVEKHKEEIDVNARRIAVTNELGQTAMNTAISHLGDHFKRRKWQQYVDKVLFLLEHPDIDPNKANRTEHVQRGLTPLMTAVIYCNLDVIRALVAHPKVDLDKESRRGDTALEILDGRLDRDSLHKDEKTCLRKAKTLIVDAQKKQVTKIVESQKSVAGKLEAPNRSEEKSVSDSTKSKKSARSASSNTPGKSKSKTTSSRGD